MAKKKSAKKKAAVNRVPKKKPPAKKTAKKKKTASHLHSEVQAPDLGMYHRSLCSEFASVRDRIRSLIRHWPTEGSFKEDVLRTILRRHLPESLMVARGFVVTGTEASTEIDILIIDRSKPTLFKADDLVIVTPDAVKAIIEVKTSVSSDGKIHAAARKLAANKRLLNSSNEGRKAWIGLFVYEGTDDKHQVLLRAAANAFRQTGVAINCIAYGPNVFATFVDFREVGGAVPEDTHWQTAYTTGLAPSVFLAYLLSSIGSAPIWSSHSRVWFPPDPNGRWVYRLTLGTQRPTEIEQRADTARTEQAAR